MFEGTRKFMFEMGKLRKVFDHSEREGEIFVLLVKEEECRCGWHYIEGSKEEIDGKN